MSRSIFNRSIHAEVFESNMPSSPPSSDLSEAPSTDPEVEDRFSTAVPSSRPSADIEPHAPPRKRRKTTRTTLSRLPSSPAPATAAAAAATDNDDTISLSSDSYSSAPGSPSHDEWHLHEEAQKQCLWKDCTYGEAPNNDELVKHVQSSHCATGGPKKTKYTCEWGECQRKTSNHPSGYALKAHMRSHTKEKPYYCALPECDKAFTRSDALAKHMRTVHEPEPARLPPPPSINPNPNDPTPPNSKKSIKLKLTNGHPHPTPTNNKTPPSPPAPPTQDEDGQPINPSHQNDNISYTPAHHPITGQPGFLITYPPDIDFTRSESSMPADQLVRLLRRQLHWAQKEGEAIQTECERLEEMRRGEWRAKEGLFERVMRVELERGEREGLLEDVGEGVRRGMYDDVHREWPPPLSGHHGSLLARGGRPQSARPASPSPLAPELHKPATPPPQSAQHTPSPPLTGNSGGGGGGFDGDAEPFDNYLGSLMEMYEERERLKNTPVSVSAGKKRRGDEEEGAALSPSADGVDGV